MRQVNILMRQVFFHDWQLCVKFLLICYLRYLLYCIRELYISLCTSCSFILSPLKFKSTVSHKLRAVDLKLDLDLRWTWDRVCEVHHHLPYLFILVCPFGDKTRSLFCYSSIFICNLSPFHRCINLVCIL